MKSFFCLKRIKVWAKGQIPPQQLEVSPRSGLYLLALVLGSFGGLLEVRSEGWGGELFRFLELIALVPRSSPHILAGKSEKLITHECHSGCIGQYYVNTAHLTLHIAHCKLPNSAHCKVRDTQQQAIKRIAGGYRRGGRRLKHCNVVLYTALNWAALEVMCTTLQCTVKQHIQ